jgi:hypothetical protein
MSRVRTRAINALAGCLAILALIGAVLPGAGGAIWTYVGFSVSTSGATSGEAWVVIYHTEPGYPVGIAGYVKIWIDDNYIGRWGIPAGGAYISIPSAYLAPGTHTFRAYYEGGDGYLPAESSGTYTITGASPPGPSEGFDRTHILVNSTGGTTSTQFRTNVSDFNGYWFMLNNVTVINYRDWWDFETSNTLWIRLNISTAAGRALVVTKLQGGTSLFGLLNTFHVSVGASSNATSWEQVPITTPTFVAYGIEVTGWNPEEFQLFVIPESGQTRLVWIWNVNGKNVAYAVYCPVVLDGASEITLEYVHEGKGYFEGYVSDSFTLPSLPPYEDFRTGMAGWMSEVLGIDLSQAAAILTSIVVLFFAVVRMTIPLLGAIVFLWIMDTIFTAVTTGEVRLIGDMFLRIYEMLMAIWRTLVGIIETIWDLITFWS